MIPAIAPQTPPGLRPWHAATGLLATWFGIGLIPVAPGTWGWLAALPFAWVIRELFPAAPASPLLCFDRLYRRLLRGRRPSPKRAASATPVPSSSMRSPVNRWCCLHAPPDPFRLGHRLFAVPPVRHLEALAGALGRPSRQRRLWHHARRHCRGRLRSRRLVSPFGDRRGIRCSHLEVLNLAEERCSTPAGRVAGMSRPQKSCTGGLVAAALTAIAGSSDVVERSFVTYSNEAKSELLGVAAEHHRSSRCGQRRDRRGTGAGGDRPRPGRSRGVDHRSRRPRRRHRREAGRARHFGLARREKTARTEQRVFPGDRAAVRDAALQMALELLAAEARN